ncbi:MAG: hypothetical protein L0Z50_14450 [Verrucomicrobiales bacterium]|nr:hypothetical protein [Verrucomicrobiales bacterium]
MPEEPAIALDLSRRVCGKLCGKDHGAKREPEQAEEIVASWCWLALFPASTARRNPGRAGDA